MKSDFNGDPLRPQLSPFEKPLSSKADVLDVLNAISFAPSCLDMGWKWEVRGVVGEGRAWSGASHGVAFRCSFQRPDTTTGAIGTGFGRWWMLETPTTGSAVIKTAWLACKQIVDHELMEAFRVNGTRPFDPHTSLDALLSLSTRA